MSLYNCPRPLRVLIRVVDLLRETQLKRLWATVGVYVNARGGSDLGKTLRHDLRPVCAAFNAG